MNSRYYLASTKQNVLPLGTVVKVNCYHGKIVGIQDSFLQEDPFTGEQKAAKLLHPLYEVELDFSRKFSWNYKRVHIPPETNRLKLFADEFRIVPDYQLRRAC